jgi:CRP-like cAMP-binding protein
MSSPDPQRQVDRAATAARAVVRSKESDALQQLDLFRHFDRAALQRLTPRCALLTFARRAVIYQNGDARDALYGILEGHVKLLCHDGQPPRRALLDILPPGTLFGEDALYADGKRDRTTVAYDTVTVMRISKADFQSLFAEYPALHHSLLAMLGERLARAERRVIDLALDGIARRLARLLLMMAERYGTALESGGVLINLKLPHREIAELVGSTRESVTMHLNDLRRQQLIDFRDRRILVTNLASLADIKT